MNPLLGEIRHNPLLWLLVFVPAVFACHKLNPESHTLLFWSCPGFVDGEQLSAHAAGSCFRS
jgi:hypothetical protein